MFSPKYFETWPDFISQWIFGYTAPPKALGPGQRLKIVGYIADAGTTYEGEAQMEFWVSSPHFVAQFVMNSNGMGTDKPKPEYKRNGEYWTKVSNSPILGGLKQKWPGIKREREQKLVAWSKGFGTTEAFPKYRQKENYWHLIKKGEEGWTFTFSVRVYSRYITSAIYYQYTFDPEAQPPPPMPIPPMFALQNNKVVQLAPGATSLPEKVEEDDKQTAEAKIKEEKILYHQNQIKILKNDIKIYQSMLSDATDPDSKAPIENMLLIKIADVQGQVDTINTIKTGNYTRTRTGWDEMVAGQMRANSRKEAAELMKPFMSEQVREDVLDRLPLADQAGARQWAKEQWEEAGDDQSKRTAVVRAITKQAQAAAIKEGREAEGEIDSLTNVITLLEGAQYAANLSMYGALFVVGASPVAMTYGFGSGAISGYHDQDMIGAGYTGATGAAINSIIGAASMYAPTVDYVISFYRGFTQLDENGNEAGVWGGIKSAGRTIIERKVMQHVALKAQRYQAGVQQARTKAGFAGKASDAQRTRAFKAQRKQGQRLVEQHQAVYKELKKLKKAGGKPYKRKALEHKLMDLTAEIKQKPHAKGFLKFAATPEQIKAYSITDRLHTTRVTKAFKAELVKQGVDIEGIKFKPIRNKGNTSPGMDLDLAVYTDQTHIRIRDPKSPGGYKSLDLYRSNKVMQKIFNKVYSRESGGRSAEKSWQMVTSNKHVEAYSDMSWLSVKQVGKYGEVALHKDFEVLKGASNVAGNPIAQINPAYANQASRVTQVKAHEMRHQDYRSRDNQNWEIYRGTAKDIESKILPNILERIKNTPTPKGRAQLRKNYDFYKKLTKAMKLHNNDPVASEHAVREITGYDDPVDVTSMVSSGLESLGAWGNRK